MKILIDISESVYIQIKNSKTIKDSRMIPDILMCAVQDGTPLPKKYEGLVDTDGDILNDKRYLYMEKMWGKEAAQRKYREFIKDGGKMIKYKVIRTYQRGDVQFDSLQDAFEDGWEFVRASEFIPEITSGGYTAYGYIEYILKKEISTVKNENLEEL